MLRAQVKKDLAEVKEELLREYTHERRKRELQSKVTESERAQERVKSLSEAAVQQAKTTLETRAATLELEDARLTHLEQQIELCTMHAPQAGVVVYPIPEDDDLVELYIKQGTIVRENQHIFSIADTDEMQVSTSIHEVVVDSLDKGMPARIWTAVDPEVELAGEVLHVSPIPDPEDWRKTTVKFYETKVKMLDQAETQRPGLSTRVEILIDVRDDVLAVPVMSVLQVKNRGVCYVMDGGSPELRHVTLGATNDQYIEVIDGLAEGEEVVLALDAVGVPDTIMQELRADTIRTEQVPLAPKEEEDEGVEIEYDGMLLGPEGAIGETEYEIVTFDDGRVERKFEVEITGGPPDATVDVHVGGVHIGDVTYDGNGYAKKRWKTEKETFPDNFPIGSGPGTEVIVGELKGELKAG
jgi:RND family efflux transporter MFP subunit